MGRVVRRAVIQEIQYHGLLVTVPLESAQAIVRDHGSPVVRAAQVLKIRPVGQAFASAPEGESAQQPAPEAPTRVAGEPIVALLDGLPLQQHAMLAGRLSVDDPDGLEARYTVATRVHGTAMASLILHGDLGNSQKPPTRQVYVRPILQPVGGDGSWTQEGIPDDELPVDLVHRAITRLFRGGGGEDPAAPSVRIINHSVADPRREFDYSIGAWARALDHLASEHQILILVSSGNVSLPLALQRAAGSEHEGDESDSAITARRAIEAIVSAPWARRLLSPAEGVNVLTVGSSHDDASVDVPISALTDLFPRSGPSPFSRHGPGYRRSVKPEIVIPGGRALFARQLVEDGGAIYKMRDIARPPGQLVATPDAEGRLDRVQFSRGTSNSVALATSTAARIFEMLDRLRGDSGGNTLGRQHEAALLKALMVHGASHPPDLGLYGIDEEINRRVATRLNGYGLVDADRVLTSTDNRATVIGWGILQDGDAHQFELPVPQSLSGMDVYRRVTITLAWMSPIAPRHRAYRRATLWFDPYGSARSPDDLTTALGLKRLDGDYLRPRRGTVQHEVFEGAKAAVFEADRKAILQVNCRSETGDLGMRRVPYGLVATVEVNAELPIYDEIRTRLRPPVPVPVGAGAGGPSDVG